MIVNQQTSESAYIWVVAANHFSIWNLPENKSTTMLTTAL